MFKTFIIKPIYLLLIVGVIVSLISLFNINTKKLGNKNNSSRHLKRKSVKDDDTDTVDYFSHDDTVGDRSIMKYCVGTWDGTEEFVFHFSNLKKAEDDFKFYSKELEWSVVLIELLDDESSTPNTLRRFGEFKDEQSIEYFCESEQ